VPEYENSTSKLSIAPVWMAITVSLATGGIAHAQSSVTLYGMVDAGLQYTSRRTNSSGSNAGSAIAMIDSGIGPSEFGLKGTEDLGDGMKANFDLESGISVANGGLSNGNGNFFGRQAWVGLSGNFGEVRLGEQFSPFFMSLYDSDPRGFSEFGSSLSIFGDNALFSGAVSTNAIIYTSPELSGLQGSAMIALGGVAGNFQAGWQWAASLKYDHGPLMLNAAIFDGNSGGTPTPVPSTLQFEGRTLGAAYRFGTLTVKASFTNYKVAGSFNSNVYSAGLDYHVLPAVDVNGGVYVTSDRNHPVNHSLLAAAGVDYFLSKSTALYAQVGIVDNHGAMDTGLSVGDANILYEVTGTTIGANVGIRHSF
jgi:predicted porin